MENDVYIQEITNPSQIKIDGITLFSWTNRYDKLDYLSEIALYLNESGKYEIFNLNFLHALGYLAVSDIPYASELLSSLTSDNRTPSRWQLYIAKRICLQLSREFGDRVDDLSTLQDYIFSVYNSGQGLYAYLQLMAFTGHLNENTVIIMNDMPGDLHPATAVEMARAIVHIVSKLGCKFIGSTYNTDFVAAIQAIGLRENIEDKINFYVSEENNDDIYDFHWLGTDIGPMFDSFNKSIVLTDMYGYKDGDK